MKKVLAVILFLVLVISLSACEAADRVSHNISREADEFRIYRRIVFYNSIMDVYILEMQGYCSINVDQADNQLEVTCLVGHNTYQKHFLGLSDNVTYTVEHLDATAVSDTRYKLIFKPDMIWPVEIDIE